MGGGSAQRDCVFGIGMVPALRPHTGTARMHASTAASSGAAAKTAAAANSGSNKKKAAPAMPAFTISITDFSDSLGGGSMSSSLPLTSLGGIADPTAEGHAQSEQNKRRKIV